MNYYPNNYYLNYPYGNQYSPQPVNNPNMQMQMPQQVQASPQSLNGKIVDSEDVVKATEVPIGGYGIFPKADLSEIYIKSWNNNGTTSIITFKPEPPKNQEERITEVDSMVELKEQLHKLDEKLDAILNSNMAAMARPMAESTQAAAKKEVRF